MTYNNPGYFVCTYFPLYFQTVLKTIIPEERRGSHGIPGVPGFRRIAQTAAVPVYRSALSIGSSSATATIVCKIILAATSAGTSSATCAMIADTSAIRRHKSQAVSAALHYFQN